MADKNPDFYFLNIFNRRRLEVVPSSDQDEEIDELQDSFQTLNTSQDSEAYPNRESEEEEKPHSESDVNESPFLVAIACDRCSEFGLLCKRKPTGGIACTNCREKRKKCTLVPERPHFRGARGTSTDGGSTTSSTESSLQDITGDESFERDSKKVTLQRILGHLAHMQQTQREINHRLDARLENIQAKQDLIQTSLAKVLEKLEL